MISASDQGKLEAVKKRRRIFFIVLFLAVTAPNHRQNYRNTEIICKMQRILY